MKRHRLAEGGYTILEVIIVLAVTGMLFFTTALMLNGKQAKNEVIQSVRSYEAQIQNTASDVANGYYPNGYSCTPSGATVTVTGVSADPGANLGCIFLGKIINLKETNTDIITVVGRQYLNGTITDVKDLGEAGPVVVANGTVNVTQNYAYQYDLKIQKAVSITDGITTYSALAFMVELGGGVSGTSTSSGSRSVLLYGIPGNAATNASVDSTVSSSALVPVRGGIRLCLIGGDGKKAEITVGAGGSSTSTAVLIDSGVGNDCD